MVVLFGGRVVRTRNLGTRTPTTPFFPLTRLRHPATRPLLRHARELCEGWWVGGRVRESGTTTTRAGRREVKAEREWEAGGRTEG